MSKKNISLKDLKVNLDSNEITTNSFIRTIKNSETLIQEVIKLTSFLDDYDVDLNERIYCVMHNITEVVKCKYCNNKASFGRINVGYYNICSNKECLKKDLSLKKIGSKVVSESRVNNYKEWEQTILSKEQINDEIISEHIKSNRLLEETTNNIIIEYISNRYPDSDSLWESWHRITKTHIEVKPICARSGCNHPVTYVGRTNKMFTTYCSDSCKMRARFENL